MLLPPQRLAEHPASGERKGLGEGGEEEAEEAKGSATQPDVDPVEGPRPQGRPGSSDSPHPPALGFLRRVGPGTALLPCLSPRSGLKKEHRETLRGCQDRVGDSPSEAPGWGGWGAVCGKELSANGNQASETGRTTATARL